MFKLPDPPSVRASVSETADFAETECLRSQSFTVSLTHIINVVKREQENDHSDTEDEDDRVEQDAEEAILEIERRGKASGDPNFYPFVVDESGSSLHLVDLPLSDVHWLYLYLLLATRMNMTAARFEGVDGALLFEEVAAASAASYWGHGAESMVFGTASDIGGFVDRIQDLCKRLGEGHAFQPRDGVEIKRRDGALDLVVWKDFADRRRGKLIGCGQCKTGTEWIGTTGTLKPDDFFKKWTRDAPAVEPVKLFFLAESLSSDRWYSHCTDAGIVFDRCRVLNHGAALPQGVVTRLKTWTKAAAKDQLNAELN